MTGGPFFLVDAVPAPGPFLLDGPEGRHASSVRRLHVGELLVLADGRGDTADAVVREVGRGELTVDVGPAAHLELPSLRVTIVQALPKGDRGELAVDLATEAGVDEIVPWTASRCVTRWTGDRVDHGLARWRSAAREAAKQSRRPYVPQVREPAATDAVAALVRGAAAALILHEAARVSLTGPTLPDSGDLVLVVGPEGGITDDELAQFRAAGAQAVRLGPEVLRASTAGAVALGALGVLTGRWAERQGGVPEWPGGVPEWPGGGLGSPGGGQESPGGGQE